MLFISIKLINVFLRVILNYF